VIAHGFVLGAVPLSEILVEVRHLPRATVEAELIEESGRLR
jgi:hypothetical protein